jgi:hypothetical protein
LVCLLSASAFADDANGSFVVARRSPSGLVIWDSAPVIAQIVKSKLGDAEANALLERDALQVLAKAAPSFAASRDVVIRIVYSKTGDVSPTYGTATFAGIERYAEITLDHEQLTTDAGHWKEAAAGTGSLPPFAQPKILGTLPPR